MNSIVPDCVPGIIAVCHSTITQVSDDDDDDDDDDDKPTGKF